jgi:hypothetical protein
LLTNRNFVGIAAPLVLRHGTDVAIGVLVEI